MNDYVMYEIARQRRAEHVEQARRTRAIRSRGSRNRRTGVPTGARLRIAEIARVLTSTRTRVAA
jgi:hypothetical protein